MQRGKNSLVVDVCDRYAQNRLHTVAEALVCIVLKYYHSVKSISEPSWSSNTRDRHSSSKPQWNLVSIMPRKCWRTDATNDGTSPDFVHCTFSLPAATKWGSPKLNQRWISMHDVIRNRWQVATKSHFRWVGVSKDDSSEAGPCEQPSSAHVVWFFAVFHTKYVSSSIIFFCLSVVKWASKLEFLDWLVAYKQCSRLCLSASPVWHICLSAVTNDRSLILEPKQRKRWYAKMSSRNLDIGREYLGEGEGKWQKVDDSAEDDLKDLSSNTPAAWYSPRPCDWNIMYDL